MIVERAREEDLPAVAAIERTWFVAPRTPAALAQELQQNPVVRLYVARRGERDVAGYCGCWIVADEVHINMLAVDRTCRRQGIARALIRHVLTEASRTGARRATLEVRRSNLAALALYGGLGFTVEAVRPRYYVAPEEDALILWKKDLTSC